ncbi:MAG TPA: LapA family protein [Syntrophomonadaceae bacterium]|nr:LapA family protein [Syntrophomonadaceae bacterium]
MQAYLIGAVFFLLSITIFVFQNTDQVIVNFITWTSPEVSLAVVVLISACIGAIITFFVDSFRQIKIAKRIKDLNDKNIKLQKKLRKMESNLGKTESSQEAAASRDK